VTLGACDPKVRGEAASIIVSCVPATVRQQQCCCILSTCEVVLFHTLCLLCTDQHFSFVFPSKLAHKALQAMPVLFVTEPLINQNGGPRPRPRLLPFICRFSINRGNLFVGFRFFSFRRRRRMRQECSAFTKINFVQQCVLY
jgi:hypothetical protein